MCLFNFHQIFNEQNLVFLEPVQDIKFLGVIIDNKLKWKEHIDYINKKLLKA